MFRTAIIRNQNGVGVNVELLSFMASLGKSETGSSTISWDIDNFDCKGIIQDALNGGIQPVPL